MVNIKFLEGEFQQSLRSFIEIYRTHLKLPNSKTQLKEIQAHILHLFQTYLGVRIHFSPHNTLSFMENLCLALFFVGFRQKQVASILNLSLSTVDTYERRIKECFNANNRQEACYKALSAHYLQLHHENS